MVYQTTPVDADDIRTGSVKIEARAYGSSGAYTNLGTATGIGTRPEVEDFTIEGDNTGDVLKFLGAQKLTISANLIEYNLTALNTLLSGATTYATTAGDAVTGATATLTFSATTERVKVPNRHWSTDKYAAVSITSIKDVTDTTTYTTEDDYLAHIDEDGYTWIVRNTAGDITSGQSVHIIYDYTPLATKTLSTGGKTSKNYLELKLTNTDDAAKTIVVDIYKASIKGMPLLPTSFPTDKGGNNSSWAIPIEIEAIEDTTRTAGDQLFKITDSQNP